MRFLKWSATVLAGAAAAYGVHLGMFLLRIGVAHKAKVLCSAVYVSHRDVGQVLTEDLAGIPAWVRTEVDVGRGG